MVDIFRQPQRPRRYNPNSEVDMRRLREAMRWSSTESRSFRENYVHALNTYAGPRYGEPNPSKPAREPLNIYRIACRIYTRSLVSSNPRFLVTSPYPSFKGEAYENGLALNHAVQEMNLADRIADAVMAAMFGMGVLKLGLTDSMPVDDRGYYHDAGSVFCETVMFDDWLHDMNARAEEDMDWCGNRYQEDLDSMLEAAVEMNLNENVLQRLEPKEGNADEDGFELPSEEDTSHLGRQSAWNQETYYRYVDLWDIFLPRDQLLVTMSNQDHTEPLRVVEWEGPERGPYHLLSLDRMPGNVIPLGMADGLMDMHELINSMYRSLTDQAKRQKTVNLVSTSAASSGQAEAVQNSADGDYVPVDNPGDFEQLRSGGIDQQTLAFLMTLRQTASWAGGNLDALGGLARQADTLGQERMLQRSSNALVGHMGDILDRFVERIGRDIFDYMLDDPALEIPLEKQMKGSDITIPFRWRPDGRRGTLGDFIFKLHPYSMQYQGPTQRSQKVMQILQGVVFPALPFFAKRGVELDPEAMMRILAEYEDMDELTEILSVGGEPLDISPSDSVPKSPTSERRYVRESVSAGETLGNSEQQMAQRLMGSAGRSNGQGDQG